MRMLLWVTSDCNLKCPLCVVKYVQGLYKGYSMSLGELYNFISSSRLRGIHYDLIELTGGEPCLWCNLEEGVTMIYESGIADGISLVSNGCYPERIFEIENMLSYYHISSTQTPEEQLEKFVNRDKACFNGNMHKPLPLKPVDGVIPADCCSLNQIEYINGKVYYCCNALLQSEVHGLTDDLVCDFNDDFIEKFKNKFYDKRICTTCLCNQKVWDKIN